jgi:hypothetical protein
MKKLLHKALIASLVAAMMIGPGQAQQTPPGSRDRVKDLTTIGGVRLLAMGLWLASTRPVTATSLRQTKPFRACCSASA